MTTETHDQKVIAGEVVDAPHDPTQPEPEGVDGVEIDGEFYPLIKKAGVVAFTRSGDAVLITTTSADTNKWVLPKGHVESNDPSLAACALRELEEETGFTAALYSETPVKVINRYTTLDDDDAIEQVTFFMGEITSMKGDPERPLMILEPSLAIRKLSYDDYGSVVLEAVKARAAFFAAKVVYLQSLQSNKVN